MRLLKSGKLLWGDDEEEVTFGKFRQENMVLLMLSFCIGYSLMGMYRLGHDIGRILDSIQNGFNYILETFSIILSKISEFSGIFSGIFSVIIIVILIIGGLVLMKYMLYKIFLKKRRDGNGS